MHVESRRVQMNLFPGQEERCLHRECSYGRGGGGVCVWWTGRLGLTCIHDHVWKRELVRTRHTRREVSLLWDHPAGWGGGGGWMCMCPQSWFSSLYSRKQHDTVKQLSSNENKGSRNKHVHGRSILKGRERKRKVGKGRERVSTVKPKDRDTFRMEEVVSDTKCQREVKLDRNLKASIWILQ